MRQVSAAAPVEKCSPLGRTAATMVALLGKGARNTRLAQASNTRKVHLMSTQPTAPHPDEIRIIEDHEQTAHKLAVWFRYPGAWATIIAHSNVRAFDRDQM